ncbi:hypothetical protein LX73_0641 [Fodinibius salinus]|uniref:Uncharacterized protein n=1 Tax=Fodinibius salinus TaxID=860790 RepID=A0A5D3YS27_9BACT|nr:hypothetical protein [Fodinibius salinus]TYP95341.1 hypothetical protein LX73_0641 [Fodinibius salinus]
MSILNRKYWRILEQWSPILFYFAGIIFLLSSLQNFIGPIPYLSFLGYIPIGSILSLIGVLSLYPNLSKKAPNLARAGFLFLVVSVITIVSISIISPLLKLNPDQSVIPDFILPFFTYGQLTTVFLTYLLFGVAVFKSSYYTQILGYLLLLPALLVAGELLILNQQAQGKIIKWFFITALSIQALDSLGIGYVIYKQSEAAHTKIDSVYSRIKEMV